MCVCVCVCACVLVCAYVFVCVCNGIECAQAPWALSNSNDSSDETIEELESIRGQQEEEHQSTGGQQEEELESTAGEQQEEEHMHTYIHIHEDQERY